MIEGIKPNDTGGRCLLFTSIPESALNRRCRQTKFTISKISLEI